MTNEKRKPESQASHEKHVEAGKKGAEARWGSEHETSSRGSESARSGNESSHEKHVEAGKKGAEARWDKTK